MALKNIFTDKKFRPLFWTQFFGALNDNFFKNALVLMITYKGVKLFGLKEDSLVALSGGVFILPFLLFSPLAGQLSDKYERSRIVRQTKLWELGLSLIAAWGFLSHSYGILLFVLFLLGIQATFFGPVKYSIIPDLVPPERMTESNAYVELGTFLAILIGTIAGGWSSTIPEAPSIIAIGLIAIALAGVATSYMLDPVPLAAPNLQLQFNPLPTIRSLLGLLREKKAVYNSVLGISWFWFFGAGILSVLPIYCKFYLGVTGEVVTAFLAMFTIGIGIGSVICEKLSFKQVEIGLVPIGSLGMTVFLVDLFFTLPPWPVDPNFPIDLRLFLSYNEGYRLLADFLFTCVFGGLFIVPLYTLVQERSHAESRSRVIAGNNILNAIFMVISSLLIMLFYSLQLNPAQILLIFAVLNVVVAVYIYSIVPEFVLRFYMWVLSHVFYRLRVKGLDKIPRQGACILVCNHVTYIDWLFISGACKRPARFVMYYKYLGIPFMKTMMRQAKAIPIAGAKEDPETLNKALNDIDLALKDDQVVCIFPEGGLTHTGKMAPLRPGLVRMLERNPVPVVPMALKGLWGSMFSRKEKNLVKKRPFRLWKVIELVIEDPIPADQFQLEKLEKQLRAMCGE